MILSLLRHADRVKIACLAQLVNVIAPIMTETGGGSFRQSIYYPFLHASKFGRGKVMKVITECGKYDSREYTDVPILDAIAVENEEAGELTIFTVAKDAADDINAIVTLREFEGYAPFEHIVMQSDDGKAVNSFARPDAVAPSNLPPPRMDAGAMEVVFPKLSWNVLRLKKAAD